MALSFKNSGSLEKAMSYYGYFSLVLGLIAGGVATRFAGLLPPVDYT